MSDRASFAPLANIKQKPLARFFSSRHFYRGAVASLLVPFFLFSCAKETDNTYDAGTANMKIMAMFAMRDLECNTTHQLNGFLFSRADRKSVDLCVDAIFLLDCSAWQVSDPSPAACKSIGVDLR